MKSGQVIYKWKSLEEMIGLFKPSTDQEMKDFMKKWARICESHQVKLDSQHMKRALIRFNEEGVMLWGLGCID